MEITLTESASAKIKDLLSENPDETGLRIYVQGGGCSGFQYGFAFESQPEEDDYTIEQHEATIYVDAMSAQYLQGATVDYTEELFGSSFSISNPNSKSTCGCGASFSV